MNVATEIKLNKKIFGNIQTENDVDYYAFDVSKSSNVNIVFTHPFYDSSDTYWTVELLCEDEDIDFENMYIDGNSKTSKSNTTRLSPGKYYIKIDGRYPYSYDSYQLMVKTNSN